MNPKPYLCFGCNEMRVGRCGVCFAKTVMVIAFIVVLVLLPASAMLWHIVKGWLR